MGTFKAPGVLKGTYEGNVVVSGLCLVNAGPSIVEGNLTISAGGRLNAPSVATTQRRRAIPT